MLNNISKSELAELISSSFKSIDPKLKKTAAELKNKYYGNKIYVRGLIEFTNYCKNDCYYCGIRKSNSRLNRYRLSKKEILQCGEYGHKLGLKTFVLQGGEDLEYSEKDICDIVYSLKSNFPDSAVTLSVGEKSRSEYKAYFNSGADRYLLRHETASTEHYKKLHPANMSLSNRKSCLYDLKEIGFQVGAGMMVGSPFQTVENLAEDLIFINELKPEMIGIGPFIPHSQTPFKNETAGSLNKTLAMIVFARLISEKSLIPSTTALNSISENGRQLGFEHGANVVMPNLSPICVRQAYSLYDNKAISGLEGVDGLSKLKKELSDFGYELDFSRGDCFGFKQKD